MPIDYRNYPADWKEIRAQVLERAGHKCESCGVANYAIGARDHNGVWHDQSDIDHLNSTDGALLFGEHPKIIRIVLTVAHLDHDPANPDPERLRALCNRCHLQYDAQHHARNARRTRDARRGQLTMEFE